MISKENFLSREDCDLLIQIHESLPNVVEQDEMLSVLYVEKAKQSLIANESLFNFLRKIESKISGHIQNIDSDAFINYFQIVKWPEGSGQHLHYDFDIHCYTSIVYLNDNYSGGQTEVDGVLYKPEKGKIITFRGNQELHCVKTITNGIRYTLPVWYRKC